jgi:hypothetical protein
MRSTDWRTASTASRRSASRCASSRRRGRISRRVRRRRSRGWRTRCAGWRPPTASRRPTRSPCWTRCRIWPRRSAPRASRRSSPPARASTRSPPRRRRPSTAASSRASRSTRCAAIVGALGDAELVVTASSEFGWGEPSPPLDRPGPDAIRAVSEQMWPGVPVVPFMSGQEHRLRGLARRTEPRLYPRYEDGGVCARRGVSRCGAPSPSNQEVPQSAVCGGAGRVPCASRTGRGHRGDEPRRRPAHGTD